MKHHPPSLNSGKFFDASFLGDHDLFPSKRSARQRMVSADAAPESLMAYRSHEEIRFPTTMKSPARSATFIMFGPASKVFPGVAAVDRGEGTTSSWLSEVDRAGHDARSSPRASASAFRRLSSGRRRAGQFSISLSASYPLSSSMLLRPLGPGGFLRVPAASWRAHHRRPSGSHRRQEGGRLPLLPLSSARLAP